MVMAKRRFGYHATQETIKNYGRDDKLLQSCAHSGANSSMFVDFARSEIVSSAAIQIKKSGGSSGRDSMSTIKNVWSSTRLDQESPP